MQGRVKTYNEDRAFGFIIGEDGNDYFFHISNWKCTSPVIRGAIVNFAPDETNRGKVAKQIILDETTRNRPTFISFGNEAIKLGNIKTYGISAGNARFVKIYEYKKEYVIRDGLFGAKIKAKGYSWNGDKEQFAESNIRNCSLYRYNQDKKTFEWSNLALERSPNGQVISVKHKEPFGDIFNKIYWKEKTLTWNDFFTETQNYLYITTYQQDNYQFYEGIADFDIYEKKKELDRYLANGK